MYLFSFIYPLLSNLFTLFRLTTYSLTYHHHSPMKLSYFSTGYWTKDLVDRFSRSVHHYSRLSRSVSFPLLFGSSLLLVPHKMLSFFWKYRPHNIFPILLRLTLTLPLFPVKWTTDVGFPFCNMKSDSFYCSATFQNPLPRYKGVNKNFPMDNPQLL